MTNYLHNSCTYKQASVFFDRKPRRDGERDKRDFHSTTTQLFVRLNVYFNGNNDYLYASKIFNDINIFILMKYEKHVTTNYLVFHADVFERKFKKKTIDKNIKTDCFEFSI